MTRTGYSGTPMVKKLGIKPAFNCWLINEPKHYFQMVMDIPLDVKFHKEVKQQTFGFVHLFNTDHNDLKETVEKIQETLVLNGMYWESWLKGKSKIPKSTNETFIRNIILETEMVDVKLCTVDEDWSGLKFVTRKERRGN